MHVLVVEDEPRLRDVLTRAIPDMGFSVCGVGRACEALDTLDEQRVDIAILDLNLPDMDGLELFQLIHERWPQTQVVILTGHGNLDAARKAIRLDVVDFLSKPASLGELEVALDRARRRRPDTAPPVLAEEAPAEQPPAAAARTMQDVEREHILEVLARNSGNRAATAAELGISVRTLYYRLSEYQRSGHLR